MFEDIPWVMFLREITPKLLGVFNNEVDLKIEESLALRNFKIINTKLYGSSSFITTTIFVYWIDKFNLFLSCWPRIYWELRIIGIHFKILFYIIERANKLRWSVNSGCLSKQTLKWIVNISIFFFVFY